MTLITKARTSVFWFVLTGFLYGCNYSKNKGDGTGDIAQSYSLSAEQKSLLSYSYVYQNVFLPKCISCHGNSGSVNLESYENTLPHLETMRRVVFESKTMPKNNSLSNEEKAILWNWIDLGAPKESKAQSEPPVLKLTPTFDSIFKLIFQVKCLSCHGESKVAKRILLDKISLFNSPLELVLPGNPEESGLIIAIEREDEKRMPPDKEGYSKLNESEISAIRTWIINGAKD